ncbi:MAG TPA: hypothetical protein VKB65_10090, partial [Myxococcota bacterium]|nr:hypothetical protein [Myxococcota bacterium]
AGAAALAAALALSCGGGPEVPAIPRGAHLVADGPVLLGLLARLEGLRGTPLGRRAVALRARLDGCDSVVGHAADGALDALLDSLDCATPPAALAAARGDAALLWVWPLDRDQRWIVTGGPGGAGLVLDARLDPPGASERAALLLPSADDAGPPVLDARDALLHARVRPEGGLDLAALVPEGSQGDRLFRLKSALLGSAVLGGVWEAAAYMPEPGEPLPPMAVALDVRRRDTAVGAMRAFVAELEAAWPIHATPARFAAAGPSEGACLFDLRILPGFAPCWVATGRALVVGWNPTSIERALGKDADAPAEMDGPSRLALRLDRLGEADRRLQAARTGDAPATPRRWGWSRLEIGPGDARDALRIELVDPEPAG